MNPVTSASMLADILADRFVDIACSIDRTGVRDGVPTVEDVVLESGVSLETFLSWAAKSPTLCAVVFFSRSLAAELKTLEVVTGLRYAQ